MQYRIHAFSARPSRGPERGAAPPLAAARAARERRPRRLLRRPRPGRRRGRCRGNRRGSFLLLLLLLRLAPSPLCPFLTSFLLLPLAQPLQLRQRQSPPLQLEQPQRVQQLPHHVIQLHATTCSHMQPYTTAYKCIRQGMTICNNIQLHTTTYTHTATSAGTIAGTATTSTTITTSATNTTTTTAVAAPHRLTSTTTLTPKYNGEHHGYCCTYCHRYYLSHPTIQLIACNSELPLPSPRPLPLPRRFCHCHCHYHCHYHFHDKQYIYIYRCTSLSVSLSLYIYIYIYIYIYLRTNLIRTRCGNSPRPSGASPTSRCSEYQYINNPHLGLINAPPFFVLPKTIFFTIHLLSQRPETY